MREASIQLVCFDLGGVIIRICRSWREGCIAAGISPRHEEEAFQPMRSRWHALVEEHQTGRIAHDLYTRRVSDLVNGLYSPAEVDAIHHAWMREGYAGADALIEELHASGVATACLSNTNAAHWQRIPTYPAVAKLHHYFLSHELGLHKPDPAIYEAVQQALRIQPHTILFFDDLFENVEAARTAGWRAATVDPLCETVPQMRAVLAAHSVL